MSFPARLHAAGLPPAGAVVTARFSGDYLIVEGAARAQIACRELTVEAAGFNRELLFLNWGSGDARHTLQTLGPDAQTMLIAEAPPSLAPALARWRKTQRQDARRWLLVGAAGLVLMLAFAGLFLLSGRAIGWIAQAIPIETETHLGAIAYEQLRRSDRLIERGAAFEAVRAIGTQLTAGSRFSYHWAIKPDASVNAFAMPGGYVVVHSGLIAAATTAEELAGVLAHEVQHVEQRHTLRALIHSLGWAAATSLIFGDVSAAAGSLIYQTTQLSYGRDLEREADRRGLQVLASAGIDPSGMARIFAALAEKTPQTIALLSSHPAPAERLAAIRADIAALPARDYPPLMIDWPAVQADAALAVPSASR